MKKIWKIFQSLGALFSAPLAIGDWGRALHENPSFDTFRV